MRRSYAPWRSGDSAQSRRLLALGLRWSLPFGCGCSSAESVGAMACTVAVEEAIDEHYAGQLETLDGEEPKLAVEIEVWWQDEARVGQKNKITRRWAKVPDRRTQERTISGAICPGKELEHRDTALAAGAQDAPAITPCSTVR